MAPVEFNESTGAGGRMFSLLGDDSSSGRLFGSVLGQADQDRHSAGRELLEVLAYLGDRGASHGQLQLLHVVHPGRILAVAVLGFGIELAAYAEARRLVVALPPVLGAGIASVLVDALVLAARQASVDPASGRRTFGCL